MMTQNFSFIKAFKAAIGMSFTSTTFTRGVL